MSDDTEKKAKKEGSLFRACITIFPPYDAIQDTPAVE